MTHAGASPRIAARVASPGGLFDMLPLLKQV